MRLYIEVYKSVAMTMKNNKCQDIVIGRSCGVGDRNIENNQGSQPANASSVQASRNM